MRTRVNGKKFARTPVSREDAHRRKGHLETRREEFAHTSVCEVSLRRLAHGNLELTLLLRPAGAFGGGGPLFYLFLFRA